MREPASLLAAAQIEQPGNLVEHGHDEAEALLLVELLAQVFNLVVKGLARVLHGLHNDGLAGASRPLGAPDQIDQVLVDGLVLATLLLNLLSQLARIGCRDDARIDADNLAALDLVGGPFLDGGHVLDALLQELPVAVELLLGLVEVAPVGGKGGLLVRDDGIACRAGEAADVCCEASVAGAARGAAGGGADLGGHRRGQCTRSDGCPPRAPLAVCQLSATCLWAWAALVL
jgi:hypothetical protein